MRTLVSLTLAIFCVMTQPAFAQNSKSIVLCEKYDTYGKPTGINASWTIEKAGGYIYILYDNGGTPIKGTLWLYVDKQSSSGTYDPAGTKTFEVKSGAKWCVYDYNFTEPGKYKVTAVSSTGDELAVNYCTINWSGTKTTTTSENKYSTTSSADKSIVLCENYDTYGKATGIYKTWNIKPTGGYVNVLYNNGGKNFTGTLWLYVDKKNSEGEYVAFDTKTFETDATKSWSVFEFTFKEAGEYKISAVSSKGEEAVTYGTIEFADGVETTVEKSIVLCDSYDDYGKPVGIATLWNIKKEGGWIYVLYNHGEKIKSDISLYVDKKNTAGKYVAYETKSFDYDGTKNWSVFDFNFKEAGDYEISAIKDGKTLATVQAIVKYKVETTTTKPNTTPTTTTTKTEEKPDTWYYDKSNVYFATTADAAGNMTGENTVFTVPAAGKTLKVVYKDDKACKTKKIVVDVYTGEDYADFVETKEFVTTSTQKVITFSYLFKTPGQYKLSIYNDNDVFMNLGMLTIKKASTTTTSTTPTKPEPTPTYSNSNSSISSYTPVTQTEGPRSALVIGNGNYVSAGTLPNPVHDAEEMAKALKACGFDVTLVVNGNRKQMNEAINSFGQKIISNKGTGMVYYAGHGVQSKGENYLIPIDASLSVEEALQYECVNVGQILSKMEAAANPINIVALDACRNNPFERSWHRSANGNGLVGINAPEGTIIAFSTNPGNVAADGSGYNSPYTTAFMNQLKKPGLTIEQVLKGVAAEVKKSTPGQMPWYSSSIIGEFFFRP